MESKTSTINNSVIQYTYQFMYIVCTVIFLCIFILFAILLSDYSSVNPETFLGLIITLIIFLGAATGSGAYIYINFDNFKKPILSKNGIFITLLIDVISIIVCNAAFIYYSILINSEYDFHEKISILFNFFIILINVVIVGLTALNLYSVSKKTQLETKEKNIQFEITLLTKKLELFYVPISTILNSSYILMSKVELLLSNQDTFMELIEEMTRITAQYQYLGSPEALQIIAENIQIFKRYMALVLLEAGELNTVNELLNKTKDKIDSFKPEEGDPELLKTQYLKEIHQNKMKIIAEIGDLNQRICSKNEELFNLTKD